MIQMVTEALEQRLGRSCAERRIAIEAACVDPGGIRLFGIFASTSTIRRSLQLAGLYERGCRNALAIRVKHNFIITPLPPIFDRFVILQLSDLHVDMNPGLIQRLANLLPDIPYDVCV